RRPPLRPRARPGRPRGRRRRVRLRPPRRAQPPRGAGRRLPPARRDALRRDHRLSRGGRRRARARPRRLRPLRAAAVRPRHVRDPERAPHRVLPRPHPLRGQAPRRRPRTGRRLAAAGPLARRPRPGAERVVSTTVPKRIDTRFRGGMAGVEEIDRRSLASDLRAAIEGEVRFDTGRRALYATDASNYRMPPVGVVIPRRVDELVEIHRVCREHGAPIVLRGGGTSLAGQGCNAAVLLDCSKYLREILEIDPDRRLARVQPGCVLDHLRGVAAEKYGLTFGPDPSTHAYCTIGGMLGNNSCGRHSVQSEFHGPGPRMADNLVELEVLTYRGERLRIGPGGVGTPDELAARLRALVDPIADEIRARYPQIPRRVSGYNLDELLPENGFEVARSLVGTESTCVTILEATLELIPKPNCVSLLVVGYPDKFRTADHVPIARDHRPISIEGMDDTLVEDMTLLGIHQHEKSMLPDGRGWLFVEFGGDTKDESDEKARALMHDLEKAGHPPTGMKLYDDPEAEQHIWDVREAGLGATAFIPGKADTYEGWEDSAVPPEKLGEYLRRLSELAKTYDYESSLYGH